MHRFGDTQRNRNRAQSVADSPCPGGFLTEHALGQRRAFVACPPSQPTDADRGEDEVGSSQRLRQVVLDHHLRSAPGRQLVEHRLDRADAGRIDIMQHDGFHPGVLSRQCSMNERYPKTTPTENGHPHTVITSTSASRSTQPFSASASFGRDDVVEGPLAPCQLLHGAALKRAGDQSSRGISGSWARRCWW